jgi:hypothetical protein
MRLISARATSHGSITCCVTVVVVDVWLLDTGVPDLCGVARGAQARDHLVNALNRYNSTLKEAVKCSRICSLLKMSLLSE